MPTRPTHRHLLILATSAIFLMGEDVEHDPVIIPPPAPEKKRTKPVPPGPALHPQGPATPEGPRLPFGLPGPRMFDLEPGAEAVAPALKPELTEHDRVSQRLKDTLRDLLARDRVRSGHIDPGWIDLAQRIEHYWEPKFEQVDDPRITEVSGPWLRDTAWKFLKGWYDQTQKDRTDAFAERIPGDEGSTAWANMFQAQRDAALGTNYGNQVVSLVEIRFDTAGHSEARLLSSSGHARYDRAVMRGVRQALVNDWRDDPPPGPARSIYAMTGRFTILPPLPIAGLAFDAWFGSVEPIYPLKKIAKGNAILVAVYRDRPAVEKERPSVDGGPPDGEGTRGP